MPTSTAKKSPSRGGSKTDISGVKMTGSKKIAPLPNNNSNVKTEGSFDDNFDSSLKDLFVSELKDMLWSEKHLVAAIPKMIEGAASTDLKEALRDHLEETKNQVTRLEDVFNQAGIPLLPKKCDALEGLTMAGEHVIENTRAGSEGREAGVIGSGIKVEQFEITCYNELIGMAEKLNMPDAVTVFQQNLDEEIAASEKLNSLKK